MIELDGANLTPDAVAALAQGLEQPRLSSSAKRVIALSHRQAARIAAERPVYGISTGVGANRLSPIGDDHGHALALLRSHAASAGPGRSAARIRATSAIRLNQLAAGGSGCTLGLAEALEAMLHADALPSYVGEYGSVGTGDLSALASIGLALQGESATNRPLPTTWQFGPHDVLPFLSSNAGAIADATLALVDLQMLAHAYLMVAALSFTALNGNAEAFAPAVERATPFPGAVHCCCTMRALTAGAPAPKRIQDPFGLRVLPQAHGSYLDSLAALSEVLRRMMNAPSENPVLDPVGGTLSHHGAFFASYLGQAADAAAVALTQSAQLIPARVAALVDPAITGLTPFLTEGTVGRSGVMIVEYIASSALSRLRACATPAGLNTAALSRGVEEDASFASLSAVQLHDATAPLRVMLACELACALRAIRLGVMNPTNSKLMAAVELCSDLTGGFDDRDLTADIQAAELLLPGLAALVDSPA